jgi:hypothetical protein
MHQPDVSTIAAQCIAVLCNPVCTDQREHYATAACVLAEATHYAIATVEKR